jgi:tRNA-dihydrouridine synthase A
VESTGKIGVSVEKRGDAIDRRISVAPMMERTDRHFRYLLRLLAPRTLLYTEMVTAAAVVRGDAQRLLRYDPVEHPVALQLGGSDPGALAAAARMGAEHGYDEINLNIGCPSERVQSGRFGVCLMREPALVADCVAAMRTSVSVPVTVKTRIGVDHDDDYAFLARFVDTVAAAGCRSFVVHARKAWLHGVSPKANRTLPPLDYERVAALKRAFPELEIIVNGGITTVAQVRALLERVDGVMIGREAWRQPWLMAQLDRVVHGTNAHARSREDAAEAYLGHVTRELAGGVRASQLLRPLSGLYHGEPGAAQWRRELGRRDADPDAQLDILARAIAAMAASQGCAGDAGGRRPKSVSTATVM